MEGTSGTTRSYWLDTAGRPEFGPLRRDVQCDVCVIGGGIAGLTTAYVLASDGLSVILLEDGHLGSGETGRTSAHLSNALDDRYYFLAEKHGAEGARLAAESHTAAIDWIERTCQDESIACEFERVNGYLFRAPGQDEGELYQEFDAATAAGLKIAWEARAPWTSFDTGRCLVFPRQAQFHPLKYLYALAAKAAERRVSIYTQTHVDRIEGSASEPCVCTKAGPSVRTKDVVVATNVPIHQRVATHTKQFAYRSYVIGALIPKGVVAPGLYWDTLDPYHYIRIERPVQDNGHVMLIVGGEDHKTGQPASDDPGAPFKNLEAWTRERFPITGVPYRWSGQIIEPADGLAFIGRSSSSEPHIYLATGDSGNGLTHGTIAGMLIADLIQNHDNPWAKLYDPSRLEMRTPAEYVKENLNVLPQYFDWLSPGSAKAVQDIPVGEAGIVRDGLKKVAVYRESAERVHLMSAVCPHLGCLVRWNGAEKTWDCPCHGSRFDCQGHVMNGPANSDLEPLNSPRPIVSAE